MNAVLRAMAFAVLSVGCTTDFSLDQLRRRDAGVDATAVESGPSDLGDETLDAPEVAPDGSLDARPDITSDVAPDAPVVCGSEGAPCCARDGGEPGCNTTLVCTEMICLRCPAGLQACGNSCVNFQSNTRHCNNCGNVCPDGLDCVGGQCRLVCPTGFNACGNRCVSLITDATHCGGCNNACGTGTSAGLCESATCRTGSCGAGLGDCDGMAANGCETDTRTSTLNCGGCGARCVPTNGTGQCVAGSCTVMACNTGFGDCDRIAANGCETGTLASIAHCGSCNRACTAASAVCSDGNCAVSTVTCAGTMSDCNGLPGDGCEVNTATNASHCGRCGVNCNPEHAAGVCTAGLCGFSTCTTGYASCDNNTANGCEVSTAANLAHCGACNNRCAFANASATCTAGACQLSTCDAGFSNCDGIAANGCESRTQDNVENCGACGIRCNVGGVARQSCTAGRCAVGPCADGYVDCDANPANGCEVRIATDVAHCGRCGGLCAFAGGAATCAGGLCVLGACNTGFRNCDAIPTNGCEANTTTSNDHCGACGSACTRTNAAAQCTNGQCVLGACNIGFGNCDTNAANGCETDTRTSSAHCGACGRLCPAGEACSAGMCTRTCPTGQTLCNNTSCVDTLTDRSHCGRCSNLCGTPANAVSTCATGVCGYRCISRWGDCDGVATNGCETNLGNNPSNCMTCGRACPSAANYTPACASAICGGTCNTGFRNCDNNLTNGCETNVSTSAQHCGRCNAPCPSLGVIAYHLQSSRCVTGACAIECVDGYSDCDLDIANGCETNLAQPNNCGACGRICPPRTGYRSVCCTGRCCYTAATVSACEAVSLVCLGGG